MLYFSGDVTFADFFQNHVKDKFEYPFQKMQWFKNADISMINLENPLTDRGIPVEKKFTFRASPDYVKIMKSGGIDIVTIANNHIYDYGVEGLFDTITHLDSIGISHVGAGKNLAEARAPAIFSVKGINIGFLAYYGLNKHSDSYPATKDEAGTALRNLSYIEEDIKGLKNKADFIVVNFHWGEEKANYPGTDQIDFAHQVIEYGADLILGHHPHVLQGIEVYKKKVIAYSLGNFIFGGNSRKTYKSIILAVNINVCDTKGYSVKIIPIQVDYWQPFKINNSDSLEVIHDMKKFSSIFNQSIFQNEP
ncbi:MAG: CapA family protein [Calditrichaceae bacterium]|nr:CapA family protein [Calditrichaceae bacterium]MBN2710092.1 CapA family protein [Calditrichaceae bacterium]